MRGNIYAKKNLNKQKSYESVVQIFCTSHQVILFQSICFAGY